MGKTYDAAIPGSRLPGTKEKVADPAARNPPQQPSLEVQKMTDLVLAPRQSADRGVIVRRCGLGHHCASSDAIAALCVAARHRGSVCRASLRFVRRCASFAVALRCFVAPYTPLRFPRVSSRVRRVLCRSVVRRRGLVRSCSSSRLRA